MRLAKTKEKGERWGERSPMVVRAGENQFTETIAMRCGSAVVVVSRAFARKH